MYFYILNLCFIYIQTNDRLIDLRKCPFSKRFFYRFLAVPRVYEKMYEKIVAVGASRGAVTRYLAAWAKDKALNYHLARMNGYDDTFYVSPSPKAMSPNSSIVFTNFPKQCYYFKTMPLFLT